MKHLVRKHKKGIVICIIVVLLFVIVKPIRTRAVMENIARVEMEDVIFDLFGKTKYKAILSELQGPIISKQTTELVRFQWYKVLSGSDSASIYVTVYKNPLVFDFYFPSVNMNTCWKYIQDPWPESKIPH